MVATNQIKKLRESNLLLGDQPFSLPLELFQKHRENTQKFGSCPLRSKPSFFQGFSHIGLIALAFCAYPCMSMPAGAAPVEIVVSCAALASCGACISRRAPKIESFFESSYSKVFGVY
jgi:hypothetical protein